MTIKIIPATDLEFALALTRQNMLPYYQVRNLNWQAELYRKAWQHSENFEIRFHGELIGSVRLEHAAPLVGLADLQIMPDYQQQGIGKFVLNYLLELSRIRQDNVMRLMVFEENPARLWYEKLGFYSIARDEWVIYMEKPLKN